MQDRQACNGAVPPAAADWHERFVASSAQQSMPRCKANSASASGGGVRQGTTARSNLIHAFRPADGGEDLSARAGGDGDEPHRHLAPTGDRPVSGAPQAR